METVNYDPQVYSAMQQSAPFATFKKTTLGKVYVTVVSPFTKQPEGVMLTGEVNEPTSYIDVWSEMEKMFFKRMNRKHFETGIVVECTREVEKEPEKQIEQFTDEELTALLNSPYMKFSKAVAKITTEAVLLRLLVLSEENDKSEKISNVMKARLSEIRASEGIIPVNADNNSN